MDFIETTLLALQCSAKCMHAAGVLHVRNLAGKEEQWLPGLSQWHALAVGHMSDPNVPHLPQSNNARLRSVTHRH